MTLEQYIADVKDGMLVMGGEKAHDKLADGSVYLDAKDFMAVTAEAFNQEVFAPTTKWEDAYEQVVASLAEKKVAKASAHDTRRAVIHPGRSLPHTVSAKHHMERVMLNNFKQMRRKTLRILAKEVGLTKSLKDSENKIYKAIDANWRTIADETWQDLENASIAGAMQGMVQLEIDDEKIISKTNTQAKDYARERSAEMVGMRRTETGKLIQNPDARWAISETTREKVKEIVADVFAKEDVTLKDVEEALTRTGVFEPNRATMIARTEVANAQVRSNLMAWKNTGMVQQVGWHLSGDHDKDDICDENADNSPYAFDEVPEFPAHPNCMCAIVLETLVGEEEV